MRNSTKSLSQVQAPARGIILLVVLSSLTFFSLLIAAYFVFSNQARQASFALSNRNINKLETREAIDDALMMLIRGTSDESNPFFGEDLLSDYYGRNDAIELEVRPGSTPTLNQGFLRFSVTVPTSKTMLALNDMFTGRIITFTSGQLENRSYRVIRSIATAGMPQEHDLVIAADPMVPGTGAVAGDSLHMNGVPRNSSGIGFDSSTLQVDQLALAQPGAANVPAFSSANPTIGFTPGLPAALQPNHLGRAVDKSTLTGDFDESYDAPDFYNMFLSHRDPLDAGKVIPSFHRPALVNYIANEPTDPWTKLNDTMDVPGARSLASNTLVALARATYRPLSFVLPRDVATASNFIVNEKFTGGNPNFVLRTPLNIANPASGNNHVRLDQFFQVLTGEIANGQAWDVDNDGDGINDSIWIDLGLPLVTSPEGKLLRPLVAVMIEDLGARLNVNAHHNPQIVANTPALNDNNQALWAGTRQAIGTAANQRDAFRGLGYGPAEIAFPETVMESLVNTRYQDRGNGGAAVARPGTLIADEVDQLLSRGRVRVHSAASGEGFSSDVFGRGGIGLGHDGNLVSAMAGRQAVADDTMTSEFDPIDEAINDPYESDPRGRKRADAAFSHDEFEAILRSNDFDIDLISNRLRDPLRPILPAFQNAITTISVSDDTPPPINKVSSESLYRSVADAMIGLGVTESEIPELLAIELRLGRKLDVNRPFGNGLDDNGNSVIDEPLETSRMDYDGYDNNGDGTIDEPGEFTGEAQAFGTYDSANLPVPANFQNVIPNYTPGEAALTSGNYPISGRQLYARHLYVLMMALTNTYNFPVEAATPATDQALYRARRIAQWAVNVVDYRDSDSIMTRFVYDPTPFDPTGWDAPDSTATPANNDRVVWGCEQPDLLLTEGLALHDVRLRDTEQDDNSTLTGNDKRKIGGMDPTLDQVRAPQGSLFLELYCPAPVVNGDEATKPAVPQELYDTNLATGQSQLDLERRAPRWDTSTTPPTLIPGQGAPVWRLAVSEPHYQGPAGTIGDPAKSPQTASAALLNSYSYQPDQPDELAQTPAASSLDLRRFILFQDFGSVANVQTMLTNSGITDMQANEVFFVPSTNVRSGSAMNATRRYLGAGQYLVVAPRTTSYIGSRSLGGAFPGNPANQRFEVIVNGSDQQLIHQNTNGTRTTPNFGTAQPFTTPLTLVAAMPAPAGWPVNGASSAFEDGLLGVNISEPLPTDAGGAYTYYPIPVDTTGTPTFRRYNGNVDLDSAGGIDFPLYDAYLDHASPTTSPALDLPVDVGLGLIADDGTEPTLGTLQNHSSVFLQRLADPTLPYDRVTNPYRTVDYMPLDLSVFSGEERGSNPTFNVVLDVNRGGLQKDGFIGTVQANSLLSYSSRRLPAGSVNMSGEAMFEFTGVDYLQHSLGFLNTDTAPIAPNLSNPGFTGFAASIGMDTSAAAITTNDRNLPQTPFARHPWLNRNFASAFELMFVPATSQGRLMHEFSVPAALTTLANYPTDGTNLDQFRGALRYLLNFFHDDEVSSDAAGFVRVFDYVGTLPRFTGEVDLLLPARAGNVPAPTGQNLLQAPFGYLYPNIRQGRINLNTIADFNVWKGLMHGHLNDPEFATQNGVLGTGDQLSFNRFLHSRRGYGVESGTRVSIAAPGTTPVNYNTRRFHSKFPTEFAGVFRNALTGGLAPEIKDTSYLGRLRRRPVNATVFRGDGVIAENTDNNGNPLPPNDPDFAAAVVVNPWLVRDAAQTPANATNPHLNRDRNAFLRYQTLARMDNLATDNSQSYLVRMTLGYFEVDPSNTDSLGAEYNEAIGQNNRYRAMFIIDRSIPVGFVPGEDLNVRKTVVFERYYE